MKPELIVMLTENDRTVENAAEVFEQCKKAPAMFWGFKEVGLPLPKMKELCQTMKAENKKTFLEIVAYTEEECLKGAQVAVDCGFDYLLGTMYFDSVCNLVKEAGLLYMPFVGKVEGRPSVLNGTIQEIIDEALLYIQTKKVDGFDLLGYRYSGDAFTLNYEFVAAVQKYLPVCLAGSISTFETLDEVLKINPWTFTIGSAFFKKKFGDSFADQIEKVVSYINCN